MKKMMGARRPVKRWLSQPATQDIQAHLARRCWPGLRDSHANKKAWKGM